MLNTIAWIVAAVAIVTLLIIDLLQQWVIRELKKERDRDALAAKDVGYEAGYTAAQQGEKLRTNGKLRAWE